MNHTMVWCPTHLFVKKKHLLLGTPVPTPTPMPRASPVRTEVTEDLVDAFKDVSLMALDIEGVDLSRDGQISLVQVAVSPKLCFLLDLLDKPRNHPLIAWLRCLLESTNVLKVVHDCRMDADALRHLLDIELCNVHDTSCWHYALTGNADVNLNTVLVENAIRPNDTRDAAVYAHNPAFWLTRPLTPTMVAWAVGDVRCIFALRACQLAASTPATVREATALSDLHLNAARTRSVARVVVRNPGRFIGRAGANIRDLRRTTDTLIYSRGEREGNVFVVYYRTPEGLAAVRRRAAA